MTEVDRHAEEIIRGSLLRDTPDARVIGEELGSAIVTEGLVWVVDPLDGTTNFLHRYLACAVSIDFASRSARVCGRLPVAERDQQRPGQEPDRHHDRPHDR